MIPETEVVKIHYGNNAAMEFDFDFFIEDETQLKVTHTDLRGISNVLQYGVDYSIHEIGNPNGSYITFPLQGSKYKVLGWNQSNNEKETLVNELVLPFTQEAEYEMSKNLNKKNLENSFDKLTRIAQILRRGLARAVKIPEGSSITPDELIDNINQAEVNSKLSAQEAAAQAQIAKDAAQSASNKADFVEQEGQKIADSVQEGLEEIGNKKNEAVDKIDGYANDIVNKGDRYLIDINTSGENYLNDIKNSGADELSKITDEGNKQVNRVVTTGNSQNTKVKEQGDTQVERLKLEGSKQINDIKSTGIYVEGDKLYYTTSDGEVKEFKSGSGGVMSYGMSLYSDAEAKNPGLLKSNGQRNSGSVYKGLWENYLTKKEEIPYWRSDKEIIKENDGVVLPIGGEAIANFKTTKTYQFNTDEEIEVSFELKTTDLDPTGDIIDEIEAYTNYLPLFRTIAPAKNYQSTTGSYHDTIRGVCVVYDTESRKFGVTITTDALREDDDLIELFSNNVLYEEPFIWSSNSSKSTYSTFDTDITSYKLTLKMRYNPASDDAMGTFNATLEIYSKKDNEEYVPMENVEYGLFVDLNNDAIFKNPSTFCFGTYEGIEDLVSNRNAFQIFANIYNPEIKIVNTNEELFPFGSYDVWSLNEQDNIKDINDITATDYDWKVDLESREFIAPLYTRHRALIGQLARKDGDYSSYCNMFADGWVEQFGHIEAQQGLNVVNLFKKVKNLGLETIGINVDLNRAKIEEEDSVANFYTCNYGEKKFEIYSDKSTGLNWFAKGYAQDRELEYTHGRALYFYVGNEVINNDVIDVDALIEELESKYKKIELNSPFFLGMSQYFDVAPNNVSWLLSNGQWNTKSIYRDYYDWLIKEYDDTSNTIPADINALINGGVEINNTTLSGFSPSAYARIASIPTEVKSFEWRVKFTTGALTGEQQGILANGKSNRTSPQFVINKENKLAFQLALDAATWSTDITTEAKANTNYTARLLWDGVKISFYLATEGGQEQLIGQTPVDKCYWTEDLGIGIDGYNTTTENLYFRGSIDLSKTYININGKRWWSGVTKPVKTLDETYTDYDWVIDTANETFRLPLKSPERICVKTYQDESKWCRVYSDNWCEQGGYEEFLKEGKSVTFLKKFADDNYSLFCGDSGNTSTSFATGVSITTGSKTQSGFVGHGWVVNATQTRNGYWLAKGYLADDEDKTNVGLYFYTGEAIENPNLINAGGILETLANKADANFNNITANALNLTARASMPSNSCISLTLGATNALYTAPADGYVLFRKTTNANNQYIGLFNSTAYDLGDVKLSPNVGQIIGVYLPVSKGDTFKVQYSAGGTLIDFRFIYAQGSKEINND